MESNIQNQLTYLQENKDVDLLQDALNSATRSLDLLRIYSDIERDENKDSLVWQAEINLDQLTQTISKASDVIFLSNRFYGLSGETDPETLERDAEKIGECLAVFWSSGAVTDEKFELGRCLITETILEKQRQMRRLAKNLRGYKNLEA